MAALLGVSVITGGIPAAQEGSSHGELHFRTQRRIPAFTLGIAVSVIAAVHEVRGKLEGIEHGQFATQADPVHGSVFIRVAVAKHVGLSGITLILLSCNRIVYI